MLSRGVLLYLRQVGIVAILSGIENIELWLLGLLEVSVSAILCHGSL